MRLTIILLLIVNFSVVGQSKKELIAKTDKLKAEIEELKKPKEVNLDTEHKRASYALGVLLASNLKNQGGDSLDVDAISQAFKDFFGNKPLKIEQGECMPIASEYMQMASTKKSEKVKEENEKFLESNKSAEGVQVTSSGIQYKVLTSGTGKSPSATDNVTVHYTGKLIDGTVFDSSVERGEPATFGLNQVIRGWTEALQLMKEGDKWIIYIPYELGYGERGAGGGQIPPYSTLIFEVELIKVN